MFDVRNKNLANALKFRFFLHNFCTVVVHAPGKKRTPHSTTAKMSAVNKVREIVLRGNDYGLLYRVGL